MSHVIRKISFSFVILLTVYISGNCSAPLRSDPVLPATGLFAVVNFISSQGPVVQGTITLDHKLPSEQSPVVDVVLSDRTADTKMIYITDGFGIKFGDKAVVNFNVEVDPNVDYALSIILNDSIICQTVDVMKNFTQSYTVYCPDPFAPTPTAVETYDENEYFTLSRSEQEYAQSGIERGVGVSFAANDSQDSNGDGKLTPGEEGLQKVGRKLWLEEGDSSVCTKTASDGNFGHLYDDSETSGAYDLVGTPEPGMNKTGFSFGTDADGLATFSLYQYQWRGQLRVELEMELPGGEEYNRVLDYIHKNPIGDRSILIEVHDTYGVLYQKCYLSGDTGWVGSY